MATKTHRAAFGSHEEVYGLTVVDNIAQDCVNGIVCRAFTSSIVSNHFDNCSGPAVTTATMTSSDNSGVLIATGNKLNSVATTNGTVQISGNYSPLVLNANFIENAGVPATGPAIRFNTQKIVNAVVKGNTINAGVGVDVLPPSSVMPTCVGLDISGNTVVSYTGNMVSLRGSTVASTPADNIRIAENFGVPTLESSGNGIIVRDEGFYGENVVIRENSQFGDSSTVVNIAASGWRMRAHPIVEHNDETNKGLMGNRSIAYGTAGTVASNVTVNRGGIIERTNPTTGAPSFWVVTTQGTEGTITGVTGDIASGSTVLTLTGNDQTRLMPLQSPTARDGDAGFIGFASRMNPVALPAGMLQLSENMRLDRGTAKTRKGARRLADELLPSGFPLTLPFRFDPIETTETVLDFTWALVMPGCRC
jgi:hypothetical protein